jgi:hypothetical protein
MSHSNKQYSKNKSVKNLSKGGDIYGDIKHYIKVTSNTNKDVVDIKSIRDELQQDMDNINKSISGFMTTYKKLTAKVNTIDDKISNITNVHTNCQELYPEINKKDEEHSKGIMDYFFGSKKSTETPTTTDENTSKETSKEETKDNDTSIFSNLFGNSDKPESDKPESDKSETETPTTTDENTSKETSKEETKDNDTSIFSNLFGNSDKPESDKPESDKSETETKEDTSKEPTNEDTRIFSMENSNNSTEPTEDTSKEQEPTTEVLENSDNSTQKNQDNMLSSIIDKQLNDKLDLFDGSNKPEPESSATNDVYQPTNDFFKEASESEKTYQLPIETGSYALPESSPDASLDASLDASPDPESNDDVSKRQPTIDPLPANGGIKKKNKTIKKKRRKSKK